MKKIQFYSQNFEDVLLYKCFGGLEKGFYIDVGAKDEKWDSVTYVFYEQGWSGINIEPVEEYAKTFERRSRDLTYCCALGSQNKVLELIVRKDGLSSFVNTFAEEVVEKRLVNVRSLNSIFEERGIDRLSFEFLKIDVEGFELEVLKGIDLTKFRPIIILCEMTNANSQELATNHTEISQYIESGHYEKVYWDGLNQWWIASEHKEQYEDFFKVPSCIFDSLYLAPSYTANITKQLSEMNTYYNELYQVLEDKEKKINKLSAECLARQNELTRKQEEKEELRKQLNNIYNSKSWKILQKTRNFLNFKLF